MMNLRNAIAEILEQTSLRNAIAHALEQTNLRNTLEYILESQEILEQSSNEATAQQYVILPILRALGWDDTDLASMEIVPEYKVKGGKVDYALKVGKQFRLFIECKKWGEPLDRHEDQIVNYAVKAGVPIVVLTNGKTWRFYRSWVEGTSVDERIFCETDIEDSDKAVSDLERYLSKSRVASGEAEREPEQTSRPEIPFEPGRTSQDPSSRSESSHRESPSSASGKAMKEYFRIPILQALVAKGGTAKVPEVFNAPEMRDAAEKVKRDKPKGNWKQARHNMRSKLVDEGLLYRKSLRGTWKITSQGRAFLKQHRG